MDKFTCGKCRYFDIYYVKGINKFVKTNFGLCIYKHKIMAKDMCCDQFKETLKLESRYRRVKVRLGDMFFDVSKIRELIEIHCNDTEQQD